MAVMNVLLFLLYYIYIYIHEVYATIYWEIQTHPVVFGENLTLYCNTSSVQAVCNQCTKRWYGGKIEDLLSFNGFAIDHSKYETTEDSNGFSLIIKHFNEEDVNISYSCTFGFYFDKKILQLPSNFENGYKDELSQTSTTGIKEQSQHSSSGIEERSQHSTTGIEERSKHSTLEFVGIACGIVTLVLIFVILACHIKKIKLKKRNNNKDAADSTETENFSK